MKQIENYLGRAFIVSSVYLLSIIVGGFFILPGVFQADDYNFPLVVELFLKVTSAIAVIVVLFSAVTIPVLKLIQGSRDELGRPAFIAAATLLIGLVFIFIHALYVKLRACPVDGGDAWYCQVEGKSYVGMIVLAFFLASLVGCIAWASQRLIKKK